METLYYHNWSSPIGPLLLVASDRGLVRLEFHGDTKLDWLQSREKADWAESSEKLKLFRRELEEYFAGKRREFTFPLDLRGTDFQKKCWRALLHIPYGETRSYADIARAIGRPKAVRAVGGANHQNPVAIVVPCHRVIGSGGSLTGYGGGLPLKEKLLQLEGARLF